MKTILALFVGISVLSLVSGCVYVGKVGKGESVEIHHR